MADFKFKLGSFAGDRVTGFKGDIVGRYEGLTGPTRYEVTSKNQDGSIQSEWFDEERLGAVNQSGWIAAAEMKAEEPVPDLNSKSSPRADGPAPDGKGDAYVSDGDLPVDWREAYVVLDGRSGKGLLIFDDKEAAEEVVKFICATGGVALIYPARKVL